MYLTEPILRRSKYTGEDNGRAEWCRTQGS